MKKLILTTAIAATLGAGVNTSAYAALASDAVLNFDAGVTTTNSYSSIFFVKSGSYFGMDTNGKGGIKSSERTAISQNDGLVLGTAQGATGSHAGSIDGSESPGFDNPWEFFGNTGMHGTSSPTTVTSTGANTADIDMSGHFVTWNGIAVINMGSGPSAGVASVVCAVDCSVGDTYTLDYDATVPLGDPSNFGGVNYTLHLVGTIGAGAAVPVPAAVWLFGSGLLGLVGVARRKTA